MKLCTLMLLALLSLGCISINTGGHEKWKLAYAHDESGACTAGDKYSLIDAVRSGADVRIVVHDKYNHADNVMEPENLWVKDGQVYAQCTHLVSSVFDGPNLSFVNDSFHYMSNFCTTGRRDIIKWMVGEHKQGPYGGQVSEQIAVDWYVR